MRIFNSFSLEKEKFEPLNPKKVLMYVCGITPYDTTHLGHAATYLFFDVVKRFLEYKGSKVIYTQNVTDIDDSILEKSKIVGEDWKKLGDYWTKRFLQDIEALNIMMPTHFVKATDSIPKMIKIVESLIVNRYAYVKNGNVYFEVSIFPKYGQLSKYNRSQMLLISKERGADPADPNKIDPLDFILWQKSLKDEPFWESPWGKGRPGWHIECSAMIAQYLGNQIDIHGGGHDLVYPHHESEIAQSESYTNSSPFVKYWMHIGMVNFLGEKMSKSLGNLILIKDLLKKYTPNAIRWMLLSRNYRSPWEYNGDELKIAQQKVDNLKLSQNGKVETEFIKSMEDDFNTPASLNIIEKSQNPKTMLKILGFQIPT